jgi:hypothetical protein
MSYEWRLHQNGTASDLFVVHDDILSVDTNPFEDCPCGEVVRRCLRVAFVWAPKFDDQLSLIHFVTAWKSDLVIVEPGNSYESLNPLSFQWTSKYEQLLEDDKSLELAVLHFPWGDQPKGRMAALAAWTTNATYASRMSFLQQSAMPMPKDLQSRQGRKTWHFACGLGKVNVESDNIIAVEPCTDMIDTAQIRALITVHFDALSNNS